MKIAIIGAGAAGLCALRHATDKGFPCDCFEQTDKVGGTWNYTERTGLDENGLPVHSSMYQGLKTNIPKEVMEYADFPYPKLGASYITQQQVLEYINGYAQHFNLHRHIKFNVRVKKVRPIEKDKWKVTVVDVKTKSEETSCYDAVMVCNGHYSDPFVPDLKGSEEFEGKQWHSHDYREPSSLKGKRVLLLGAGPSGADIGAQIATVAKKVFLSHGTKLKTPLPEGIAQKPYVVALTKNGAVFQDSTEETVGEILYCTGYKYTFPFLTPECGIEASSCKVQPLYKQVININRPTMCVIGIPFRVCPFPMFDVQVNFFLETLTGHFVLPSKEEMLEDLKREEEEKAAEGLKERHFHLVGLNQEKYFNDLADTAGIKRVPPVVCKIYVDVTQNRNINDRYEIISDSEYRKL